MSSELIRASVRDLKAYVPGEQPQGRSVIKLNTNENPYPPSPAVVKALQEFNAESLRLYPNPVSAALRERIAELHNCGVDQVFAGNGSDEILALCTRAFVENNGSIGYFDPSYSLYPVLADIRDVSKRAVPLNGDFGWVTPPEDLCSLFFLTNPNAPTSMLFDKENVERFCASFRGVVLIDEAYVDFSRDDCMDLALRYENVLTMRTFSKSYSLAGSRVGYVVGDAALIEALMKVKDSYNLDGLSQCLALAALSDVEGMRANVTRIISERERLTDVLKEYDFAVCPSETNFLWVKPPDGFTAEGLFEALRKRDILIRYFPGEKTGTYVRITIGTQDEVDALLVALSDIMKEQA